jgi:hypothetical protein
MDKLQACAHPLYQLWVSMRARCNCRSNKGYAAYGARGITVAPIWNDFWQFASDMGERPSPKHSIDRINNKGNYEPKNCRWATPSEQQRNTRRNRRITLNGETLCITEWAKRLNVTPSAISHRIRKYGAEKAIAMGARKP